MINQSFISSLEGESLIGYVPKPDGGAIESGVTVGCGFDIGQRSRIAIMRAFGVVLGGKLAPYASITGYDAIDRLSIRPLVITQEECGVINEFAHKEATDRLVNAWDKVAVIPFTLLADECQTVVASVAYQYGSLAIACPNFWRQTTTGDWKGALANLRNFGDAFTTRRNKEADLLEYRLKQY
jgi:GH24 family phage-related lysozyme (muramidase)